MPPPKSRMRKSFDWEQWVRMKRFVLLGIMILPLLVTGQRFGVSQAPSDQRSLMDETFSESPIPIELFALEKPIDPDQYRVGPGDQIAVSIQTSQTIEKVLTISPTGFLMIPGVGRVDLRGLNLTDAIIQVNEAILQNFKNARVSSGLVGIRQIKVAIVGAVVTPGFYTVTPVSRLSDLLELARPRPMALLNQITINRLDGSQIPFDLTKFYLNGDLSQNPMFLEGDQVQITYGDLNTNAIVVRGAVNRSGYDYLKPGETLGELITRRVDFRQNADLGNIKVVRTVNQELKFITVAPNEFNSFLLEPGDDIEFLYEKPVNVQGYVAAPGSFSFIPGYTAGDYITLAGGLLSSGTMKGIKITRVGGAVLFGEDVVIQRGDIIEV
ncbi:MAG: hypothetical protein CO167_07640, partial [Candidatus Marinimicrobia bacterium CG_4_9_14_3_um_filter_48_9]